MNIYDLETEDIGRTDGSDSAEVFRKLQKLSEPTIFENLGQQSEFVESWTMDFFEGLDAEVPVQRPEPDGVNYFVDYFRLPMREFVRRIRTGEDLYIGAREILKRNGVPSDLHGLAALANVMPIPSFIDKDRIWSSNLWVGAGNNNTLLHYDPWDSIQLLGSGKKEFLIFPPLESRRMKQYGPFHLQSLKQGRNLHSKIRPLNVQAEYAEDFSKAKGWRAVIEAGDMIAIPTGYWHFVRSTGTNIGVNYFMMPTDKSVYLREPMRSYWIKDNITLPPFRLYKKSRRRAGQVLRSMGLLGGERSKADEA